METMSLPLNYNYLSTYVSMGYNLPEKIAKSIFKRQNEFVAGRLCAVNALEKLTGKKFFVGQDGMGRPVWPDNVVGSITHTDDIVIAGVAKSEKYVSIGIDLEKIIDSSDIIASLEQSILVGKEKALISKMDKTKYIMCLYLFFSFKESLYKCLKPITKKMFSFEAAEVIYVNYKNRIAHIRLVEDLNSNFTKGFLLTGRFKYMQDINHIFTSVAILNTMCSCT
ncbi:phosphopantetheinyltransferase component of enterobactin synthase multienzyme complex [Rickettsia tamurae subsp. buchneri]|uniref:Enterobactin synthase component D n=2 Tax=Rickettsia tamurae TaxID=334545 RepID=A0A8E1BZK3_9RICK|nr:phosphopantetheinyltransferase component of enterobactin synthase multienzyme complex [Rickettsia tamurae subsp. buchneri]